MREFEVDKGFFGAAGSPLVEDGKVIANVGGKKGGIVAFDAKTGKVIWTATTDAASYSSGIATTMLGRRYAVFLTRAGLVELNPAKRERSFQAAMKRAAGGVGERSDAGDRGHHDFGVGAGSTPVQVRCGLDRDEAGEYVGVSDDVLGKSLRRWCCCFRKAYYELHGRRG